MAYSYVTYTGNGTNRNFPFTFPYLEKAHVHVTVGFLEVGFSWLSDNTVQLATAPLAGEKVIVSRVTPKDYPPVVFTDTSILLERDLNLLAKFGLYVAQETADTAEGAVGSVNSALYEFRGVYYGPLSAAPNRDPNGNVVTTGDIYLDTSSTAPVLKIYDGSGWVPLMGSSSPNRSTAVATAGQKVFTTPPYVPGTNTLLVFLNGVKVPREDYVETSRTSITFNTGRLAAQELEFVVFSMGADFVSYTATNDAAVAALGSRVTTAEGTIASQGTAIAATNTALGTTNTTVAGHTTSIGTLNTTVAQHTTQINNLTPAILSTTTATTAISANTRVVRYTASSGGVAKLTGGTDGQFVTLFLAGGGTSFVAHNGTTGDGIIYTKDGANYTAATARSNITLMYVAASQAWFETARG